jgi:hypothetical protein
MICRFNSVSSSLKPIVCLSHSLFCLPLSLSHTLTQMPRGRLRDASPVPPNRAWARAPDRDRSRSPKARGITPTDAHYIYDVSDRRETFTSTLTADEKCISPRHLPRNFGSLSTATAAEVRDWLRAIRVKNLRTSSRLTDVVMAELDKFVEAALIEYCDSLSPAQSLPEPTQ